MNVIFCQCLIVNHVYGTFKYDMMGFITRQNRRCLSHYLNIQQINLILIYVICKHLVLKSFFMSTCLTPVSRQIQTPWKHLTKTMSYIVQTDEVKKNADMVESRMCRDKFRLSISIQTSSRHFRQCLNKNRHCKESSDSLEISSE